MRLKIKYLITITQLLPLLLLLLKIKYLKLITQAKKTYCNANISKIENKITTDHDHNKYITTQEFNKLTSKNFIARLKQVNLASKSDIANLIKKTDLNKDELNEISRKVKLISTKGLTKSLIKKLSILDGVKYFFFRNISKLFGIYTSYKQ